MALSFSVRGDSASRFAAQDGPLPTQAQNVVLCFGTSVPTCREAVHSNNCHCLALRLPCASIEGQTGRITWVIQNVIDKPDDSWSCDLDWDFRNVLRRVLISLSICIAAAVLETFCAGTNVGQRFDELALPAFALPMWCWVAIGAYYYAMCFVVLYRIFLKLAETRLRSLAFSLVISLMIGNALWNLAFFQPGYLLPTLAITIPYALLALFLFLVLWRVDRLAMGFVVPYLPYLIYVIAWTYAVWQLNGSA